VFEESMKNKKVKKIIVEVQKKQKQLWGANLCRKIGMCTRKNYKQKKQRYIKNQQTHIVQITKTSQNSILLLIKRNIA